MQLGGSTIPGGSCSDEFAYGDCTWYVATRRCIPWGGNANAWYYNASRLGYEEGSVPEVGAVAVWNQGQGGANAYYGHVAYVEAVGPDVGVGSVAVVPAGDFEISEMNWDALGHRRLSSPPRRRQLLPGLHLRSGLSLAGGRRHRPVRAEPAPPPPAVLPRLLDAQARHPG